MLAERLRVLIVGSDANEIERVHQAVHHLVGDKAVALAIEAPTTSTDLGVAWGTRGAEIYTLHHGYRQDDQRPVRQPDSEDGDVWRNVTDAAALNRIGLVVIASHRQSRLRRLYAGSAVHDLLDNAHLPVLVVPEAALDRSGI